MSRGSGWGAVTEGTGVRSGRRRGGRKDRSKGGPKPGDVVLDTGGMLAVLEERPGHKLIEARMAAPGTAVVETLSLLEVMYALTVQGLSTAEVDEVVDALALQVEAVDESLAREAIEVAGEIIEGAAGETDDQSPSPFSLLCSVALSRKLGLPMLTVDTELEDMDGVEVVTL